jgi:hypothetical protein
MKLFFFIFRIYLSDSIPNDRRMPIINHLVDDLHKRLNELENLYSTVKLILISII